MRNVHATDACDYPYSAIERKGRTNLQQNYIWKGIEVELKKGTVHHLAMPIAAYGNYKKCKTGPPPTPPLTVSKPISAYSSI